MVAQCDRRAQVHGARDVQRDDGGDRPWEPLRQPDGDGHRLGRPTPASAAARRRDHRHTDQWDDAPHRVLHEQRERGRASVCLRLGVRRWQQEQRGGHGPHLHHRRELHRLARRE